MSKAEDVIKRIHDYAEAELKKEFGHCGVIDTSIYCDTLISEDEEGNRIYVALTVMEP